MKNLKSYKVFESSFNIEDILFDLNDIFIDLEDYGFIASKDLLRFYNWFSYSIKGDKVLVDIAGYEEYKGVPEGTNGFSFLIKVDLNNFEDVKDSLLRAFGYMKTHKDWEINILFSYNDTFYTSLLTQYMKPAHYLNQLDSNEINHLIDDLKTTEQNKPLWLPNIQRVPKSIEFNTYKN